MNRSELSALIDPHFLSDLKANAYIVNRVKPIFFLTANRFDLGFKLVFLEMMNKDIEFAQKIYRENISACGLGKFFEPGNQNKNSFNDSKIFSKKILDKNIIYLNKIVELCAQNNISLKIFISPTYAKHIDLIYTKGFGDSFEYWKMELVKIADVFDFSGRNTITNNPKYYMDASHYNSNVGSFIFARMFNDNSVNVPKDFGTLLNKENINSFLINYRKKINYNLKI